MFKVNKFLKKVFFFLLLLFSLSHSIDRLYGEKAPVKKRRTIKQIIQETPQGKLALIIHLPKEKYAYGEPIIVTVKLLNISQENIMVFKDLTLANTGGVIEYDVIDKDGYTVYGIGFILCFGEPTKKEDFVILKPGQFVKKQHVLGTSRKIIHYTKEEIAKIPVKDRHKYIFKKVYYEPGEYSLHASYVPYRSCKKGYRNYDVLEGKWDSNIIKVIIEKK